MSLETKHFYDFGDFRLDLAEKVLLRDGKSIPITPKVFETICVLVESAGQLVEKDELMRRIWQDRFVEESNITFNVGMLRKALGDDASQPTFIETVQRRGYRFIAEVRRVEAEIKQFGIEDEVLASQLNGKPAAPERFLPSTAQSETQNIGAVVDLADWQREASETKPEESAPVFATETSNGQIAKLELFPAKAFAKNKRNKFFYVLAGLILGAMGLGYYFFYAGRIVSDVDGKKSIAILPLKPINTANRDEIYEIGIADSLILKLSSIKGFIVRPLSATRKYADIEQDALAAGREQQVDYVLASNYQLAGGKIRITIQLFNVATGQIEETYKSEKDAANLFAMQDAIAGDIGNKLLTRFATTSSSPTAKLGTTNEEAYRLYLQGRNLTYNRSAADARKAIEAFEQAVKLDPNFARAYSGMAHAFIASGNLHGGSRVDYEKAKEVVTKALELDSNLAEGYVVSGELKFAIEWDYPAGEKDLLRAIELEPNSNLAHEQYASYLAAVGRFDEAIAESTIALEIDPNSYTSQRHRGRILYLARRYDEAILQFKRVWEVHQDLGVFAGWLWVSYEMKGDHVQAYEWFMKIQKRTNPQLIQLFQNAYETSGWQGVRQKVFELQLINEQNPSTNYYGMARQCALMGEKEKAFEYLNKAIENRAGQVQMLNVEPPFDILRDDPRFDELVRRVGLK